MPDVRLILTLRDPVDRAWSAARRVLSRVANHQGIDFSELQDSEFYEYFDKEWAYRPERGMAGAFVPGMLQGHYCRAIDHWTSYFPREQLLVCFFHEIENNPEGFMTKILHHIGASVPQDWSHMPLRNKVNRNLEKPMPDRFHAYLCEKYRAEIEELHNRFGEPVEAWMR
jgi:hypothetical protein